MAMPRLAHLLPPLITALALNATLTAQTSFDNDRLIAPGLAAPGILTEGFPGPPVVAIPIGALGLMPLDDIDALSYGDDITIQVVHAIVFSPDALTDGLAGSGVVSEITVDTAPGTPPAAAGDIFIQSPIAAVGNLLAPAGSGYMAGTGTGDEANAAWASPCFTGAVCADLDAFDYTDPATVSGVYFSLAPGSPTLGAIGAGPGDILYSDLLGGLPIVAVLAGAGPANAPNLGITGLNLDALNCVGSTGPIGAGGGVIAPGLVGPSVAAGIVTPSSTHLLQYSVSDTADIDAEVLVRVAAGVFDIHTPSTTLGLTPTDDLNALEVRHQLACPPTPSNVFVFNGINLNIDAMAAGTVVTGTPWTATISPQITRGPGPWIILMRTAPASGPILDLGTILGLPPAGLSELLVAGTKIANFFPPPHGGGGTSTTFSVAVPPSCSLVGMSWFAQSIVFGDLPIGPGVLDPWFSSAVGGVVGTF